jgi:hypothetical protein
MIYTMQANTTVGANASVATTLNGQLYERPPYNCYGTLFVTGSATGLFAQINVNSVAASDEVAVNTQNRVPVVPDDMLMTGWEAPAGGLIQLKFRNSTGGALTGSWKILLEVAE